MKLLLLGGHGIMGPHVARALEDEYELRITDIVPIDSPHENLRVDVADLDQVMAAAAGVDAIVNFAVVREDHKLAFDVNTLGTYNAVRAAVEHKMERFINTGPYTAVVGPTYHDFDFDIRPEVAPHPGLRLYPLSKSAGQEVCRIFAENNPIHVLNILYFRGSDGPRWARSIKLALEVDLADMPTKNEVFFIGADPTRLSTEKNRRLLGFEW